MYEFHIETESNSNAKKQQLNMLEQPPIIVKRSVYANTRPPYQCMFEWTDRQTVERTYGNIFQIIQRH